MLSEFAILRLVSLNQNTVSTNLKTKNLILYMLVLVKYIKTMKN